MQQQTFTDIEYSRRKKKTRREEFLDAMDQMIRLDRTFLSIRQTRPSHKRDRDNAADVPDAELVQPFRCCYGGYDL